MPQYAQSPRVFGKEYRIRVEITHAEACVSQNKGFRSSIESSTRA